LTPYISEFFDTRIGAKTEAESYKKIAASFSYPPAQFFFISDAGKEIEAARSAGMQAILCIRVPGAAPSHGQDEAIHHFGNVLPD
jgi:enolase-phosphatase E1